jgi:hypothetical protein
MPIYLLKDYSLWGGFNTIEIEKCWNVKVAAASKSGWLNQLEWLFLPEKKRMLHLDSDMVLLGPVLEYFEGHSEDFVFPINYFVPPHCGFINKERIREFDPNFQYDGRWTIDTTCYLGTTGLVKRDDFGCIINWGVCPPRTKYPDIFLHTADMGSIIYVLSRMKEMRKITIGHIDRMSFSPNEQNAAAIKLRNIIKHENLPPIVIHWHGHFKLNEIRKMERSDILEFFQSIYYSRVKFGKLKRWIRTLWYYVVDRLRPILDFFFNKYMRKKRQKATCD